MNGKATGVPLPAERHPCGYLSGLTACFEQYLLLEYDDEAYCSLLEHGFRRFGSHFFRPACPGAGSWCGACLPLRVSVERFAPSRSQRRVTKRGLNITMHVDEPRYSDEKYEMYCRHKVRFPEQERDGIPHAMESPEEIRRIFYDRNAMTRECEFRMDGRLIAVSFLDVASRAASSIYAFFDPEAARWSPGTFSILREIEYAARCGIKNYYLGYTIAANRSMRYKMEFRPCEFFDGMVWKQLRDKDGVFSCDPATIRTTPICGKALVKR